MQISIITPMYNASSYIESYFLGVSCQTIKDFEVILVDDCSTDDTILKAKKYPFKIIEIKERQAPAKVRNYGAKNSSCDVLIFVDADIVLEPDSIEKIIESISEPGVDAVSGIYSKNIPRANFFSELQNLIPIYRLLKVPKYTNFINSAFCAIRRNVFEDVGGYDEKMSYYEDIDFGHRLIEKGYKIKFDPNLRVTHLKYYSHLSLLSDYFKKVTASAVYKRLYLQRKIKNDELPKSLKIAGIAVGFAFLSLFFIKISVIPFMLCLSVYSIAISPLLWFLIKNKNLIFGLKSYFACFEIFLVSFFAFGYGFLRGKNA
ncbi:MAG: glycosyltransferase [Patescibacteria group bacterium]